MTPSHAKAAIEQLVRRTAHAWNGEDSRAFAQCFTTAGTRVTTRGVLHQGQAAIERSHQQAVAERAGAVAVFKVVRLARVTPDLAVITVEGALLNPRPTDNPWITTLGAVCDADGQWRIASQQSTLMPPGTKGWFSHRRGRLRHRLDAPPAGRA